MASNVRSRKSIDAAKAEYAYFDELYRHKGSFVEYLTSMKSVQLSYLIDPTMFLEDRVILIEGMLFANKALIALDNDNESSLLTSKEKIKQIKEAYNEFKKIGKYSDYDEFEDSIFEREIKKYVKRYCKNNK